MIDFLKVKLMDSKTSILPNIYIGMSSQKSDSSISDIVLNLVIIFESDLILHQQISHVCKSSVISAVFVVV